MLGGTEAPALTRAGGSQAAKERETKEMLDRMKREVRS
jgi:hypothetical protein